MPLPENIAQISALVKAELAETAFACDDLVPLTGGNANFVFRGHLAKPLADGTTRILIKHGEGYVSSNPSFALPTSRCSLEFECLASLKHLAASTNEWCSVRTPKLHHFNPQTNTQVQEYLPDSLDLKTYAFKHFLPSTPESKKAQCIGIGLSLGRWLKNFHEWVAAPEQAKLRTDATANVALQKLKHATYYEYLIQFVDKFPTLLGDSREVFDQVKAMSEAELADDATLQVVHGDFWTGNALIPDREITEPVETPMFIVDWEVVSLGVCARDVGQMMAELYMLKLFKDIDAGLWIIEGYLEGYGALDEDTAFRVAIHVGCHLVVIGGSVAGWGEAEDVERVVAHGRDMIVKGWQKDKAWFEGGDLKSLFRGV